MIVVNPVDVMCSRYGSHVLRSLLCFCKGVPLDSSEDFHVTKSSTLLAERLSSSLPQPSVDHFRHLNQGLPDLLKYLVEGLLKHAKEDIAALRVNMYSSLVMQAIPSPLSFTLISFIYPFNIRGIFSFFSSFALECGSSTQW